jgi:hypothetical protein
MKLQALHHVALVVDDPQQAKQDAYELECEVEFDSLDRVVLRFENISIAFVKRGSPYPQHLAVDISPTGVDFAQAKPHRDGSVTSLFPSPNGSGIAIEYVHKLPTAP